MTRSPALARRVERLLGRAVVSTTPVSGGDTSTATRIRLSDGTLALAKTHPQAPPGFFAAEAAGLRWLGAARESGGAEVPEMLAVEDGLLVMRWVEPTSPSADAAESFGRALARTHASGAPAYGGPRDAWIGRLPMPNTTAGTTWAEFFLARRVTPYVRMARERGALDARAAATLDRAAARVADLVPEEGPSRVHGDLWNGNVVWGATAGGLETRGWLVDPAAHGGHREADLAMLALFGLPHLDRVLEAYDEECPLADGWRERLDLHQLFPLLVHTVLFGRGYAARAVEVAARYAA